MLLRKQWKLLTNEGLLLLKFKIQFSCNIIFGVKTYFHEKGIDARSLIEAAVRNQSFSNKLVISKL